MYYCFLDNVTLLENCDFYIPLVFNASIQRDLSEFMRDLYNTEIRRHEAISLQTVRAYCPSHVHSRPRKTQHIVHIVS